MNGSNFKSIRLLMLLCCVFAAMALSAAAEDKPFMTWFNPPPKPIPHLQHRSYHSTSMDTKVGYNIYLPPGYDAANNTNRYPVIYWFHGRTCNESNDQFPSTQIHEAIVNKIISPILFVYASGGSASFYSDSHDGRWLSETTIINELIPHIDSTYRTIPNRGGRAVQGMSMGGFGAMKMALKYPDLFSSVVAFAGGYRTAEEMRDGESGATKAIFEKIFNNDSTRFMAEHPISLARERAEQVRGKVGIKFFVGSQDFLLRNNRAVRDALQESNLPFEYDEVPGIGHELPKYSKWLGARGLEFAVKHFAMSQDSSNDGPWVNPPKERITGLEHHIFWSDSMKRPVGYTIYLPPQYHNQPEAQFPTVYYLHGRTDAENNHIGNIRHLDQAIRDGKTPPMIYIYSYAGRLSSFTDAKDGSVMGESVIIKDLIPHIDQRWRTIPKAEARALEGWSTGGFGALKFLFKHPNLFASAVAYSGGWQNNLDAKKKENADTWQKIFGEDPAYFLAESPAQLARLHKERIRKHGGIRIVVGDRDFLLDEMRAMHSLLNDLNIAHEYEEIPGIEHNPGKLYSQAGVRGYQFNARHFQATGSSAAPR